MINQRVAISESSHDKSNQTMHQIMVASVNQLWLEESDK